MNNTTNQNRSQLIAILTEQTCGDACWHAREDICRCSCGGKNHGCLRKNGAEQPIRTAKIDGVRYKLVGVGTRKELYNPGRKINQSAGYRNLTTPTYSPSTGEYQQYYYCWHLTDKHAPARLKPATKDQIKKWPELTAYRENNKAFDFVHLLWQREEMPEKPQQLRVGSDGQPLVDQTPPLSY